MRNSVRRASLVLALTPVVSAPMVLSAFAATGGSGPVTTVVSTPAPPGGASAAAVDIDGVLSIGKTGAHAGSDGGAAHADALDVLGNRVSGGDQTTVGSGNGNLIGTGDTPVGDAEVAPWSAKVSHDNGGYQSQAEAALAHLDIANAIDVFLFHSTSSATWSQDNSTGDSQSDAAEVSALGLLDVKVLHSEAHSGQTGKSDLVVINGSEIGSNEQANGQCDLDAEPLLHLLCLTASGGTGSNGVTTSGGTVVKVDVGNGQLGGIVSGSTSQGGSAGTPAAPAPQQHRAGSTSAAHTTSGSRVPTAAGAAGLPFTGSDVQRLGAIGAALAALGGAMTAFARRRRSSFAL